MLVGFKCEHIFKPFSIVSIAFDCHIVICLFGYLQDVMWLISELWCSDALHTALSAIELETTKAVELKEVNGKWKEKNFFKHW